MESVYIHTLIMILGFVSVGVSYYSSRTGSPLWAILSRWTRWFFFAFLASGLLYLSRWTPYPLEVLFPVSFLLWFVVETAYNWLAIHALSRSDFPLFPRFKENEAGSQWPSENRFIRIRDWLRREGFRKSQALVAMIDDQILMRLIAFENEKKTVRLHILFLPNQRGSTSFCYTFYSQTKSGIRIITDNLFLPFGGFYPENWEVERIPLVRSLEKLLYRHHARMDAVAQEFVTFDDTPEEQINNDQEVLEKVNRDLGFLNKRAFESEIGKLSPAGRARIWQEIWTLSYLGKPLRYSGS